MITWLQCPDCSHSRCRATEPTGPLWNSIFHHVANCSSTSGFKEKNKNNYYVLILILSVHNGHGINWRLFCHMWLWAIITPYFSLIIKIWFFHVIVFFFFPNLYSQDIICIYWLKIKDEGMLPLLYKDWMAKFFCVPYFEMPHLCLRFLSPRFALEGSVTFKYPMPQKGSLT